METRDIIARCDGLKTYWAPRNKRFKDWYKLIRMEDELAQDKMESFVGNDPQASFKLMRHMLTQKIPHRVPQELLTEENSAQAALLSEVFEAAWSDIFTRYRMCGKQGWLADLAGLILATGWYSVFAVLDGNRAIAEIWNPAAVFPMWDDELVECARIVTLPAPAARRMAARNSWPVELSRITSSVVLYDYWRLDDGGNVLNSIALNRESVKPETVEHFRRIPIFISPVGGLPDTGIIMENDKNWIGEMGTSVVATNEHLYKYWNKWWTYVMQTIRDTVQARLIEKNRTGKPIVKPEEIYKRGTILRMTPEEDVGFLQPPALPVELRTTALDMESMMQRGGPAWAMFGGISGQVTSYVMSQISASVDQIIRPFHDGIVDCMTDIDNFWLGQMKSSNAGMYGKKLPPALDPSFVMSAEYEIRIPGDLIQRATVARMLDPQFSLSNDRVMSELFPEVKDSIRERARIRADAAERNPIHSVITLIRGLRKEAELLRNEGNRLDAELYEKAATTLIAQLAPQQQEEVNATIGNRTEAVPPEGTTSAPAPIV